jgi:SAM-dependent methyltransferase
VDLFADAMSLPFAAGSFDSVLCTQVLEHVCEPLRVLEEVRRVLKPGGRLVLTAPQYNGLHGEPQDFFRYTRYGLDYLAKNADFRVDCVQPLGGFLVLFAFLTTLHFAPLRLPVVLGCWQYLHWKADKRWFRPKDCIGYLLVATRPETQ